MKTIYVLLPALLFVVNCQKIKDAIEGGSFSPVEGENLSGFFAKSSGSPDHSLDSILGAMDVGAKEESDEVLALLGLRLADEDSGSVENPDEAYAAAMSGEAAEKTEGGFPGRTDLTAEVKAGESNVIDFEL